MTDAIADTSVFVAWESGRSMDRDRVPERIAVSMITIGELRAGVLAAADSDARQRRLQSLVAALELDPIPIDQRIAEAWAHLFVALGRTGKRVPINDSWIAATAIALGVPLVTQDRDYSAVPGLVVVRV
ncbi:MAG: type II toxin-antitoxin system VapC family toxin [Candidatus Limnocylindrales bacterium]